MEHATNPELADLIERSSLNTPAARALQDLAYDDEIAAVLDRAGYRPPTAAVPPARSVDGDQAVVVGPVTEAGSWGTGKTAVWAELLQRAWPDHEQTYPTGSHRHKTVVDVVAALGDVCAVPRRQSVWSRLLMTSSRRRHLEALVETEAYTATLLSRFLTHYLEGSSGAWDDFTWDDTHRVRSARTVRSAVYVFVDESVWHEDSSLSARHVLEQLRNAIVHGMHGDAGFDVVRAGADAFVCQIKNYSSRPVRDLAITIPLPMATLWVIRPTADSLPSVVLSRPDDDHWTEQPIRAINIDAPGSLTRCN